VEQQHTLSEKQLALEAAVTAQRSVEAVIERLRVESAERNENFSAVQGKYYRVGADISRLEQAIQHRKLLIQRQHDELNETNQQLAEISGHIADDQVELQQLEELLGQLNPSLDEANRKLRESEHALRDAEEGMERRREDWEQVAQSIADTQGAAQVEEARIEQLSVQLERVRRAYDEQVTERNSISFGELESALEGLIGAEESLRAESAQAMHLLESIWQQTQQLRADESEGSQALDQLRERLQNDRGRMSSLEALQEAALGTLSKQVDGWLQQRDLHDRPRLAQTLNVEPGWERAVETVLDGYLQAVTVPNLDLLADELREVAEGGLAIVEDGDGTIVASDGPQGQWLAD
jgi:chromosome segregation protein